MRYGQKIFIWIVLFVAVCGGIFYVIKEKSHPLEYYAPSDFKIFQDGSYNKATNTSDVYQIKYPKDFDILRLDATQGGFLGTPRASFAFPQDAFENPKSNFGEAYLTIRIGDDSESVTNCYVSPDQTNSFMVNGPIVNNLAFKKSTITDAGAGNFYESRLYRILKNNRCYEISLTVHTTNIGNYDPGTVVEFDKEKAYKQLEEMFQSFSLKTIINSIR